MTSQDQNEETAEEPKLTFRAEFTAYSSAFISIGILPMIQLIVPLWCLVSLGMSATMIGIAAGARSLLAAIFSIHSGAVLDRIGVRRVMIWCTVASIVLTLMYPVVPDITSVIIIQLILIVILQLLTGFMHTIGWIGCQTQLGQLTKGSPKHMGRFTSVSNFANFFTPPLAGWAWDIGQATPIGGAWAAFGVIAACNIALWISVSLMPVPDSVTIPKERPRLRDLWPRLIDYKEAFRLFLIPSVAFVVMASLFMNGLIQVRMNFMSIYMESIGYEGRIIGLITGFAYLIAGVTALPTNWARKFLAPHWIVIFMILLSAIGNAIVPVFDGLPGLTLSTVIFGAGVGLGMAYILMLLSRSVPVSQFGLSVGLRTTGNRVGATIVPPLAGLAIDLAGGDIGAGFYAMSILFTVGAIGLVYMAIRSDNIRETFSKK
ncbi:MAG: MFS transporter [Alphaproteobacteria bacterium]|nr:MFS transporter [Alphaproteobacteria bacterium]